MTRAARSSSFALLSVLLSAAACTSENSKIGSPCDNAEQCGGDLICNVHDGKGTCQEPHDHGTAGEETEAHETNHHETEAHETDDHGTESTSPTEATTEHGETEHDHTGTTADTTTSTG
ncbi:hypothetical protein [Nannocystis pusilla]|uniref:hypothetical protein n=1 Tax=Nannocystis pusilla TaxID=889268 RepID=UPI003DA5605C